jgi:hypothetical protein
MTNAEREEMERELAKDKMAGSIEKQNDNEHDLQHDMRSLNVPAPMSREDRQGYGDFS